MDKSIVVSVLFAAFGLTLHAQTINVRGTITNAAGQPVNKAVVELVKRGLKDTTAADGVYQITGSTSLRRGPMAQQGISLEQGVLRLSLAHSAPVKVEVFDLRGNQLRMEAVPDASEGEYRWDFATHALSDQMMIIKASLGSEVRTFRYLPGAGDEGSRPANGFTTATAFLAKAAAAIDTIRVTAAGHTTKNVPVGTYDTTANIALSAVTPGVGRSAGCGKTSTLKNGKGLTFTPAGGQARTYNLRVPDDYDNNTPYRLIAAIHWLNGTANNVSDGNYYGLWPLANPAGSKSTTIFIAPQGLSNSWPNGNGPFITSLVNMIKSEFCIDTTRVFAEGFSMGGSMSYALACEAPDIFRAVAVHSGGGMSGCNKKNKPVAYFMTHGTTDNVCTYPGFGVPQINEFAKLNGCQAMDIPNTLKPTDSSGKNPACADYTGCNEAYPTRACIFVGGHVYNPGGSSSWVPGETWKFITKF